MLTNILSLLVGIIGVFLTILFYYKTTSSHKSQSNFFVYKTHSEEKLVKDCKWRWRFYGLLVPLSYFILTTVKLFKHSISESPLLQSFSIVNMVALFFMLLVQYIYNNFFITKSIKSLDKKISTGIRSYENYADTCTSICALIAILGYISLFAIKSDNTKFIVIYIALITCIILKSLHTFFLYTYIKLRLFSKVSSIIIKTNSFTYENIFSYSQSNGFFTIAYLDNNELKQALVPTTEVLAIESTICKSGCLLNAFIKNDT